MKKTIFTLIVLLTTMLSFAFGVQAQSLVGSFEVNKQYLLDFRYTKDWNIRMTASEFLSQTIQCGIIKDTLINETVYQVVEVKENDKVIDSLFYRQEGNKVYRYAKEEKKDHLIFDFGLNVGESFTANDGSIWIADSSEEEAKVGNNTGKMIVLKGKQDGLLKDIWFEPVGSLYTGILTNEDLEEKSFPQLIYCRQSDAENPWLFNVNTPHYKNAFFQYQSPGNKEEQSLFNEIREDVYQDKNDRLFVEFIKDSLRIYGAMKINCYTYLLEARIRNKTVSLNVCDIHYGEEADCQSIYWVDIKIPEFEEGEYEVKYNEHVLGTITCANEVSELIFKEINQTNPTLSSVYDLNGHRLGRIPQKGIYLLNGKKRVAKSR